MDGDLKSCRIQQVLPSSKLLCRGQRRSPLVRNARPRQRGAPLLHLVVFTPKPRTRTASQSGCVGRTSFARADWMPGPQRRSAQSLCFLPARESPCAACRIAHTQRPAHPVALFPNFLGLKKFSSPKRKRLRDNQGPPVLKGDLLGAYVLHQLPEQTLGLWTALGIRMDTWNEGELGSRRGRSGSPAPSPRSTQGHH